MPRRARWLLLAGAGAALAAMRPFRVEVAGDSMEPTLHAGDWLVATRGWKPRRGDVVVLAHPGRRMDLVKRVAAVPGETFDGRRLGPDEYGVVGDNPAASTDGRAFGSISRHAIEGKVRFRYHPGFGVVGRDPGVSPRPRCV